MPQSKSWLVTVLAVLAMGNATAGWSRLDTDADATTAPSGDYLDPWRGQVYYYDSTSGALVPAATTMSAASDVYFDVDVHEPQTFPDATTGYAERCYAGGYCVASLVAMANPALEPYGFHLLVQDGCRQEADLASKSLWSQEPRPQPAYYDRRHPGGECATGWAHARLYVVDAAGAYHLVAEDNMTRG